MAIEASIQTTPEIQKCKSSLPFGQLLLHVEDRLSSKGSSSSLVLLLPLLVRGGWVRSGSIDFPSPLFLSFPLLGGLGSVQIGGELELLWLLWSTDWGCLVGSDPWRIGGAVGVHGSVASLRIGRGGPVSGLHRVVVLFNDIRLGSFSLGCCLVVGERG
ncbi:hypothetical protein ACOSP7_013948 [Xanthoceras sorbifolium]